jgi:hypothetical protein
MRPSHSPLIVAHLLLEMGASHLIRKARKYPMSRMICFADLRKVMMKHGRRLRQQIQRAHGSS